MLSRHLLAEEQKMQSKIRPFWSSTWAVAISAAAAGVFLIWRFPNYRYLGAVGEGLIVAAVLACVVDPLLKRNLLVEASRGIFIHLLGFEHRPEVKDKLKEIIFETKLLRKSAELRCLVQERDDGFFDLTVEYDSEIINPTNTPLDYAPWMEFDKAHKLEVFEMVFTSSDGKYKWHLKPEPEEKEPGVETVTGKKFSIQPECRGITYKGHTKYRILLRYGYCTFYAGRPTLRTMIHAIIPAEYEASATPATVQNGNYWQCDSIQMKGDHVTLRWRKRDGEWL
jgi:hypothetical protein